MNRIVLGAFSALLLVAAGLFWWQGRAKTEKGLPPPQLAGEPGEAMPVADLPTASGRGQRGALPPQADEATREERRFNRVDRDHDGQITRNEMLAPRAAAFRRLDKDGNNLLSFEEWAVRTSDRFRNADANRDGRLTRPEYATTKPRRRAQPQPRCRCPQPSDGDAGEPDA